MSKTWYPKCQGSVTCCLSFCLGLRSFPGCGNVSAKIGRVLGKTKQLAILSSPSLYFTADLPFNRFRKENKWPYGGTLRNQPTNQIRGKWKRRIISVSWGHLRRCPVPSHTQKRGSPVMTTDWWGDIPWASIYSPSTFLQSRNLLFQQENTIVSYWTLKHIYHSSAQFYVQKTTAKAN